MLILLLLHGSESFDSGTKVNSEKAGLISESFPFVVERLVTLWRIGTFTRLGSSLNRIHLTRIQDLIWGEQRPDWHYVPNDNNLERK